MSAATLRIEPSRVKETGARMLCIKSRTAVPPEKRAGSRFEAACSAFLLTPLFAGHRP